MCLYQPELVPPTWASCLGEGDNRRLRISKSRGHTRVVQDKSLIPPNLLGEPERCAVSRSLKSSTPNITCSTLNIINLAENSVPKDAPVTCPRENRRGSAESRHSKTDPTRRYSPPSPLRSGKRHGLNAWTTSVRTNRPLQRLTTARLANLGVMTTYQMPSERDSEPWHEDPFSDLPLSL